MKVIKKISSLLIVGIFIQPPYSVMAQDGNAGKNIEIHGFLLGANSVRTTGEKPTGQEGHDFLLAEERVRLDMFGWMESIEASARVKGDFLHDNVSREFDADLREAYLDYRTGDFDFRLGRQIVTWGIGDLIFINDVFPKDYVSFFSGRPLEYLKIGSDALRTRYSSELANVEFLVIPFFEPNNLPTSERFLFLDPFSDVSTRNEQEPETAFENTQLALRLYRRIKDFDVSAYAYRGFWLSPNMKPDDVASPSQVIVFYPELSVYGLSAQGGALNGIVSFETGYYQSRQDQGGKDPFISNSQIRILIGYQRQVWEDFTVSVQYYGEYMTQYDEYIESLPEGAPLLDEYRDLVTVRLTQLLMRQTLELSFFAFYSRSDEDYMIIPKVKYNFTDELSALLGANIFGGPKDAPNFGRFDKDDNIFALIKYAF
ncbi:MAG: hypothetical protein Q8P24_00545 [Desulfobacterales bacterium]|nr:hypothetical protein [Desulfobacterales bacterium]